MKQYSVQPLQNQCGAIVYDTAPYKTSAWDVGLTVNSSHRNHHGCRKVSSMADKPRLSVRLLMRCNLAADCPELSMFSMASMESALAAVAKTDGTAAVCKLGSKLALYSCSANKGNATAWESDAAGAAVAKAETARARLGL